MRDYLDSIAKTIRDSISELDEEVISQLVDEIVKTLKNNHKVVITGLGKNEPICQKFVGTMLSFGLNVMFINTNTAVHGDMGAVHNGDLLMILSKSGETAESVYLLKQISKRDVATWALTFNANSSLASKSNNQLIINIANEGDLWNIVPNNSATMYLIVLQVIAIEVARRLNITLDDFKSNHPGGYIGVQLNGRK